MIRNMFFIAVMVGLCLSISLPVRAGDTDAWRWEVFAERVSKLSAAVIQACLADPGARMDVSGITGPMFLDHNIRRACGQGADGMPLDMAGLAGDDTAADDDGQRITWLYQRREDTYGAIDTMGIDWQFTGGTGQYSLVLGETRRMAAPGTPDEISQTHPDATLYRLETAREGGPAWVLLWRYSDPVGNAWALPNADFPESYPHKGESDLHLINQVWQDRVVQGLGRIVAAMQTEAPEIAEMPAAPDQDTGP